MTSSPIGFATLPPAEADRVRQAHPELVTVAADRHSLPSLVVALTARDDDEAAQLSDLITAWRVARADQQLAVHTIVAALLSSGRLAVSSALVEQAQRNAEAQAGLAEEFGLLTAAEVADLAGSRAENTAALASRWRSAGHIFALEIEGVLRHPGFQFDERGGYLPIIGDVLTVFSGRLDGWELALWFTGSNDWLGGLRPVDVFRASPDEVVRAAQSLADELLG